MKLQVPGTTMLAAGRNLAVKLGRDPREFSLTLAEFNAEYNCAVGPQQFGNDGKMTNDREVTFVNEPEAVAFLLKWS